MFEEESEVFEINDFTTASEWERFVARIEEVLHEWKLSTSSHQHGERQQEHRSPNKASTNPEPPSWEETVACLQFADYNFSMTHHQMSGSYEMGKETNLDILDLERAVRREAVGDVVNDDDEDDDGGDDDEEDAKPEAWFDLMDRSNIFPSRAHCLHRWYGLKEFVVMTTTQNNEEINNQSRANMLLSSLSLAALNTGCQVPMFVQIGPKWRRLFLGTLECPGFRTTFEMAQFNKSSDRYNNMNDFSDLFKEKLGIRKGTIAHPAQVSVRFSYVINDWSGYPWTQLPPDFDNPTLEVGVAGFGELPFGSYEDPINEFFLYATWPVLSESTVTDYGMISALDPLFATNWSVRARMSDRTNTLMGDYLKRFLNLCISTNGTSSSSSLKSHGSLSGEDVNASLALQRLTEPKMPSLGRVVRKATSRLALKPEEAPIPIEILNVILNFLFPDAKLDSSQIYSNNNINKDTMTSTASVDDETDDKFSLSYKVLSRSFKSAPPTSLTSQLATCMCIVNKCHGGLRSVNHLWEEFVLEMRYRWENNYLIPNLESGAPNMGCSLLHQKLQMLNCCIERKKARDASSPISNTPTNNNKNATEISSEEEEFFECMEISEIRAESSANIEPEGRLKPLDGNISLLEFPDRLIYIPVTQEPAPMTEDLLEEHAEVLSRLGTSAEGAHLRARMQSACLLSDMEAFKAANPGCTLGDFVRWYSPRDWVEEMVTDEEGVVTKRGHLSQRMEVPDNMWVEVWSSARNVPAWRQRRLFDDTKEAEKVLHWLASMKPSDVGLKLMPMLVQSAVTSLLQHPECQLPFLRKHLSQITNKLTRATRCSPSEEFKNFEDVVHHLTFIEQTMAKAQSLLEKLRHVDPNRTVSDLDLQKFVSDLMEFPEVIIRTIDGELPAKTPLGALVHKFFLNAYKTQQDVEREEVDKEPPTIAETYQEGAEKLPKPMGKEYIFRLNCRRPAPWSRSCPQRFYCVITPDEFRLAGAFTSDSTFL